jgi:hypothetical protein
MASGSKKFIDSHDSDQQLTETIIAFLSSLKINHIQYLQLVPVDKGGVGLTPVDTGLMSHTAQLSAAQTILEKNFIHDIFFSTLYATYVHRKGEKGTHFFPAVADELVEIFLETLRGVFSSQGWQVTIT